jgi:hypothetical protein
MGFAWWIERKKRTFVVAFAVKNEMSFVGR